MIQTATKNFLINKVCETEIVYLFDNVVRIWARETSWLQEVHDIKLRDSLPIKEVLILLSPNDTTEAYLILVNLQRSKMNVSVLMSVLGSLAALNGNKSILKYFTKIIES